MRALHLAQSAPAFVSRPMIFRTDTGLASHAISKLASRPTERTAIRCAINCSYTLRAVYFGDPVDNQALALFDVGNVTATKNTPQAR